MKALKLLLLAVAVAGILELALMRIENKTYGVCCETGRLIPKERLRCVPITTRCLDAKLKKK